MTKNLKADNRRKDLRTKIKAKVKFTHPSVGSVLLDSGDISDGGVFLFQGEITPPELGESVTMKVVRYTHDGMGLQFDFGED